jgi:sugar phosphate isomerase/epimerase
MQSRKKFIYNISVLAAGSVLLPSFKNKEYKKIKNVGVQLYSFRKQMDADAMGTLKQIASLGFKQIESAKSNKGHYYGLTAREMKQACKDLGMTLSSGHVHIDDKWKQTMDEAAESGQQYLICSSMPANGQTVDNYKKTAELFNKAGEDCKKLGIKFGYHNHEYEFESNNGQILYDVLLDNTEADLVHMEMDLGWVIVGGKNPLDYFNKYPGRFPLWHLKDMDIVKKHSVEFGKGALDIMAMLKNRKQSGLDIMFIEQEEYASTAIESMRDNMEYLKKIKL